MIPTAGIENMDKDVRNQYFVVVGQLKALADIAKNATCMPNDDATGALIVAIQNLSLQAYGSALRYANTLTAKE